MEATISAGQINISNYLKNFRFLECENALLDNSGGRTKIAFIGNNGKKYPKFINEYWTARQRQANSIHEITYRACFKPQLPRFFIELLTKESDVIYDPFSGRGTTVIEAALLNRNIISNDVNPLSEILVRPRLFVPSVFELEKRLRDIKIDYRRSAEIDLTMFYHPKTEAELVSIKKYLEKRKSERKEDELDLWIRMVATNRLTGHSPGFFSVYTLPPNQAVSPESQKKINETRKQKPEYRNTKEIIVKKTIDLTKDINEELRRQLKGIGDNAKFICGDSRYSKSLNDETISLTVTSPPFLDVVNYSSDNWLRCWFNGINAKEIEKRITMTKSLNEWCNVMKDVFKELYRITKNGGWVAFEVGEVRSGKVNLDEYVVELGINAGFKCESVMVNRQQFTKTANIWGIKNNEKGTNTNRVVMFNKGVPRHSFLDSAQRGSS